ncbi:MAG: glycosyltransferase [Hyphomicrobiales bacterium]|nr:glycosyltransferase [Hyphomicrobiales bacterium]MCP5372212.1 glycosyltransferase [Hyphomicrobiales bacterium]
MTGDGRRRVLFVSTTLGEGGAERFVANACNLLDPDRFDVEVAVLRPKVDYPVPDRVAIHDLGKRRVRDNPAAILRLRRLARDGGYHVVVGALSTANRMLHLALAGLGRRPGWVARVDSDPRARDAAGDRGPKRALERRLLLAALARADRILAISRGSADSVRALLRDAAPRLVLMSNPVDFADLDRQAAQPAVLDTLDLERPVVVTVARMEWAKRLDLALRAFAAARAAGAPGHLVLCGDGTQRAALEALARDLGIADRVSFLGFRANPFAEMRAADLFVLSSDREGLPNALVEAQGLGLPAVATDCRSGPAEIVADGETGLLVPTGDVDALARALGRLLADGAARARFGAAARERARRMFDVATQLPRLEEVLLTTEPRP